MTRQETLLATTSIVFAILVGEAAARWLLPGEDRLTQSHRPSAPSPSPAIHVYDPELGWVLSAASVKSHHRAVDPDGSVRFDVIYSIRHGERLTSLRPQSGPMIIATGCSFTFGHGLNDEDSWPWLLQEHLPNFHVANVASMAYGTDQALLAAEREASRFPSEVRYVVLGFADFQIERNRCPQSWLWKIYPRAKPLFVQVGAEVQSRGLRNFWSFGTSLDSIIDHSVLFSRSVNLVYDRLVYPVQNHDGARQLTVALITDFARRFQLRGIGLVVAVLPHLWDQSPQSKADRSFVIDQLRAAGIPTLVPDIPRLPNGRLDSRRFVVGTHPNRQYNMLLTNQMAELLCRLNTPKEVWQDPKGRTGKPLSVH